MFGLVGKYIGNKETKGCHKCWLKLWLKDRGGGALSYGGFSDCVIVSVTELLVHPAEWPAASGKHFSTCEESLIPGAEVGFAICVCGTRKTQPLGTSGSQLVRAPTQILGTLIRFKSLLVCRGHIFQSRNTTWAFIPWAGDAAVHANVCKRLFLLCKEIEDVNFRYNHSVWNNVARVCAVSVHLRFF